MRVLLADLTKELINRYPKWMAETTYKECEVETIELSNISKCLNYIHDKKFKYDKVVIFGHRIPDLAFIFIVKNKYPNIIFEYVQHGFFKPRLERSFLGLIKLSFKKIYYIKWVYEILKISIIKGFFFAYYSFLSTFVSGKFVSENLALKKIVFSKVFLLNLDYRDYFEKYMKLNTTCYEEMPSFDASRFLKSDKKYDVVIFAQTFVEDGRMSLKEYLKNINFYISFFKSKKICFFLHPRSDLNIYKNLNCEAEVNTFSIPEASLYLSDYSTLSIVAHDLGLESYLINISGHDRGKRFDKLQEFKID